MGTIPSPHGHGGGVPEGKGARATQTAGGNIDAALPLQGALRDAEQRLRSKEIELREVRELHAREAREARVELTRAIEAQRARVEALEGQLKRARRKVKTMARPAPTRAVGGGRQKVTAGGAGGGGGGCGGGGTGAMTESSPVSTEELLNMLAAADEEVFEAKGRTRQLEYEVRARSAEADALRLAAADARDFDASASVDNNENSCAERRDSAGCSTSRSKSAVFVGAGVLASVTCAARLTAAEAEVERLRDEGMAAGEAMIQAQRESSALRLAAQRTKISRADGGRSREKELRRQVSAHKREADRLRAAAGACLGGHAREGAAGAVGGAGNGEQTEAEVSKARAQVSNAREEAERRGRTIVALRVAKTSLSEELGQERQKAADVEAKLVRALKDAGVKADAVKAFRTKISALEAELETTRKMAKKTLDGGDSNVSTGSGAQGAAVRELRAERERLRANARARQELLSKQAAEMDTRVAELGRLEQEAGCLRAAVARKDDAYRATKKQVRRSRPCCFNGRRVRVDQVRFLSRRRCVLSECGQPSAPGTLEILPRRMAIAPLLC